MYATEINDREKQLGFVLGKVPNGSGIYCGREEYVYAVVYNFDEANMIVKERYPLGGYRYCHRLKDQTVWKTVSNTDNDPRTAIQNAREYISNAGQKVGNN